VEKTIENVLISSGFKKIKNTNMRICGYKQYIPQATIGNTIYGTKYRVDFIVYGIPNFIDGVVIQSKYQGVSGTADEKFPKVVLDIHINRIPTIVVISGGGASKKAVGWIKSQVGNEENLIAVMSIDEIINYILRM